MLRKRGWRSRKTGRNGRKTKWLIALVIAVLFMMQTFIYIERNMKPPLMSLAKVRVRQLATEAINTAIANRISQNVDFEKLIEWKSDKNGKITGFMLNYAEHMRIASDTTKTVQGLLDNMKAIPEHIPLGQAMGSAILASFGPNVPIRLTPVGVAKVDLNTRYQNAGINTILVEVYIHIVAEVNVIIPFDTEPEIVETELPVSYSLVVGDVPMYYFDNNGKPVGNELPPPTLSIPTLPNSGGGAGSAAPLNPGSGAGGPGGAAAHTSS
ncbi:sporulation protein YunB [Gordoniibacillus kamchatkensis]|uniref:sporulation protein YunB n=1 Tax=Gordoniibacillus kamchatkensis TaxID=1590651 RepID=UPI0009E39EFD|nr:sporulation protein YunB [Paenibacillus sp. VKM B-2647]